MKWISWTDVSATRFVMILDCLQKYLRSSPWKKLGKGQMPSKKYRRLVEPSVYLCKLTSFFFVTVNWLHILKPGKMNSIIILYYGSCENVYKKG